MKHLSKTFALLLTIYWLLSGQASQGAGSIERIELNPLWVSNQLEVVVHGTDLPAGDIFGVRRGEKALVKLGGTTEVVSPGQTLRTLMSATEVNTFLAGRGRSFEVRVVERVNGRARAYTSPFAYTLDAVDLARTVSATPIEQGTQVTLYAQNLLPGYRVVLGRVDPGTQLMRRVTLMATTVERGELGVLSAQSGAESEGDCEIRLFLPTGWNGEPKPAEESQPKGWQPGDVQPGASAPEAPGEDPLLEGLTGPQLSGADAGPVILDDPHELLPPLGESDLQPADLAFFDTAEADDGVAATDSSDRPLSTASGYFVVFVEGPDGSSSRKIELQLNDDSELREVREGLPGPVATQATVPSVTQMPLSEAVEMLRERGLNALPVDDASHCEVVRDLQSGQWPLYWVKHQGIAPEEPLATSSLVLLSVDVGRTVGGLAGGSMGTGISNLDEPTEPDVGVGPGDKVGGLVDGGQGGGNTGSPGRPPLGGMGPPLSQSSIDIPANGGIIDMPSGGGISNLGPSGIGQPTPPLAGGGLSGAGGSPGGGIIGGMNGGGSLGGGLGGNGSGTSIGGISGLDSGPGSSPGGASGGSGNTGIGGITNGIDTNPPQTNPAGQVAAAILKIVLTAIEGAGNNAGQNQPGMEIAQSILQEIVNSLEAAGTGAPGAPGGGSAPGSVSILTIAQSLSGSVGVSLDAGQLAQLQSEWQLHVAANGPPGGTNFQQAQVMAVFILDWLSRNGQAPLSNLTLTPGPNGGVALGANDQGSDAWVKPALDLLAALLNQGGVPSSPGANGIPGGPTPGATGGGGPSGPLSTGDPPPPEEAPTGEALVEYKRRPDLVNVPDVKGKRAGDAFKLIRTAELKVLADSNQPRRSPNRHDLVRWQRPDAGWQPTVDGVTINVGVPVPDVVGQNLSPAAGMLKEYDLKWQREARLQRLQYGPFAGDLVVSQDPAPHSESRPSIVEAGTAVTLDLHTKVPDVVRRQAGDAKKRIHESDLRFGVDQENKEKRIEPYASDVVIEQSPQGGEMVAYYTPVEVTVRMKTPNVVGEELARGEKRLTDTDLIADYRGRYPRYNEGDVIVAQSPRPGELIGHYDSVALELRVPVPRITGMALEQGKSELERVNLLPDVPNQFAYGSDTIRGQSPTETHIVNGRRTRRLVEHGSSVRIDPVVARVPSVVGQPLGDAYAVLNGQESFAVHYDSDLINSDIVTGQTPRGGTEMPRGQSVTLSAKVLVPNVVGQGVNQAVQRIQQAGGDLRWEFMVNVDPRDVVIDQSVRNQYVNPRTVVRLDPGVIVPNMVGSRTEHAHQALLERGLSGRIVTTQTVPTENSHLDRQTVVRQQSIPAGRGVRRGTNIDLAVTTYQYVPMVTVPNLVGKTAGFDGPLYGEAGTVLKQHGFPNSYQAGVHYFETPNRIPALADKIYRQEPAAGTRIPMSQRANTTIKVWVYAKPKLERF